MKVYHGTSLESAKNILLNKLDISKSEGGYFGVGFYTTPDKELAKSNYADFSDEGVVLEFTVLDKTKVLDLTDAESFERWKPYSKQLYNPTLYKILVRAGIDGVSDNSFGGIVFYNDKVLQLTFTKGLAEVLWSELGNVPCDEEDDQLIDEEFLHFPKYTDKYEIWHWFESTFNLSVAEDLMYAG